MRISTAHFFESGKQNMHARQADLMRVQNQLGSGKRLLSAADDPAATQRLIGVDEALSRLGQFERNANAASARLSIQDSLLTSASTTLQRVRDLVLQGRSGTLSNADRRFVATEVRARLEELVQIANGTDANGDYLFAGHSGNQAPFILSPGGAVAFVGDQGVRELPISDERRIADADSGFRVFQDIRGGNGRFSLLASSANAGTGVVDAGEVTDPGLWNGRSLDVVFTAPGTLDVIDVATGTPVATGLAFSSGTALDVAGVRLRITGDPLTGDRFEIRPSQATPVFDTLRRTAEALEAGFSDPASQAAFNNAMNRNLLDLDHAIEKALEVQTSVGARLNAIDTQQGINEDVRLQLETSRSGLEDLDYVEASIRLNQQMVALQAAQQAFVRTSGLNLFALL
ncbi:MAG TPA: flagellar hook-associated protein 3 [Gammaproteobacteria bacterium]|nr:flagellar hook-associated protein 3 [Gammaproteobacteria bacterium]